jgi:hypothetical protein
MATVLWGTFRVIHVKWNIGPLLHLINGRINLQREVRFTDERVEEFFKQNDCRLHTAQET